MPSLRSSPWILGAPHNGLATLIWRISWRISTVTAGRPQRCFDFHRQYDLNPPRCQRITVSGRTIARAPYILGNSRQMPPNINLSIETNRSLLGLARRSTLICCLSTRISASSATCDRNRSLVIPRINRHKSSIGYQHRAILSQLPARLNLRQGQRCHLQCLSKGHERVARNSGPCVHAEITVCQCVATVDPHQFIHPNRPLLYFWSSAKLTG